jgi:hypothetical protein
MYVMIIYHLINLYNNYIMTLYQLWKLLGIGGVGIAQ